MSAFIQTKNVSVRQTEYVGTVRDNDSYFMLLRNGKRELISEEDFRELREIELTIDDGGDNE